jgi:hypothetical protein
MCSTFCKKMTDTRNRQLSAALVVIASILVMFATWLINGDVGFNPIQEGLTILLLIWLLTGSQAARWIVGALAVLASLVAIIGIAWLASRIPDPSRLGTDKWASFGLVGLAGLIYGIVSWRLLIWPRRGSYQKKKAESGRDGD